MNMNTLLSVLVLAALLLPSCASTTIVEAWRDAGVRREAAANLFVIGVVKSRGPRSRIEDAFVKELQSRGVAAAASTAVFPDESLPPREVVAAKVRELGSDGVLVVRFLKKESGDTHTPSRLYKEQPDFDETWQDARTAAPDTATPETSYAFTVVSVKTVFYRTGSDKPVWSALTETKYQNNPFKQVGPFAAIVVQRLVKDEMIK